VRFVKICRFHELLTVVKLVFFHAFVILFICAVVDPGFGNEDHQGACMQVKSIVSVLVGGLALWDWDTSSRKRC